MMQPSDHELDKIINEASDKHKVPGADPDWDKMRALLDIHMPVKKGPRRFGLILWPLLLLLLAGSTYFFFTSKNTNTSRSVKEQQQQQASAKPVNANPSSAVADTAGKAVAGNGNKNKTAQLNEVVQILPNKDGINGEEKNASGNKMRTKNKKGGRLSVNKYAADADEDNLAGKTPVDKTFAETIEIETPLINEVPQAAVATPPAILNNQLPEKTVTTVAANAVINNPADTTITSNDKKKKPAGKRRKPFEISLLYAPELTTIGFSYIDKPGSNYGLLLGYHLSKNTTLQTGFIQSRKNYIANGDDYNLGYPQTAAHKLTKVDGYCLMYEIPLNIKAQIHKGKKINWFYSAGISSYFMKREFYTYHYATTGGNYNKSVAFNSQKNYWFSVASIGAGIEKKISDNFTIAAAPFLKIPFKGMGEGKLKLLGTGINFSLTYQPGTLKK